MEQDGQENMDGGLAGCDPAVCINYANVGKKRKELAKAAAKLLFKNGVSEQGLAGAGTLSDLLSLFLV